MVWIGTLNTTRGSTTPPVVPLLQEDDPSTLFSELSFPIITIMYSVSGGHPEDGVNNAKSHARFGPTRHATNSPIHEKSVWPRHLVHMAAMMLACVKPRLTWLMHYRDHVVRSERSSDEHVDTLQELRFGTKESRQGLAVSDSISVSSHSAK